MAAAYRVTYRGPGGECPPCIVPIPGHVREGVEHVAAIVHHTLVSARGGGWQPHEVSVTSIEYVGPWFEPRIPDDAEPR